MADKSKIPTVILEQGNTIPEGAIIITAPEKKKPKGVRKPGTQPKKKRFRDSPYQEFNPRTKGVKQAFKGGGRAYGKNS